MKELEKDIQLSLKYKLADREIQRSLSKVEEDNKEVIRQTTEAALLFINNKTYYKILTSKKPLTIKQELILSSLRKSFPLMNEKIIRKILLKSFYLNETNFDVIFITPNLLVLISLSLALYNSPNSLFFGVIVGYIFISMFLYDFFKSVKV